MNEVRNLENSSLVYTLINEAMYVWYDVRLIINGQKLSKGSCK